MPYRDEITCTHIVGTTVWTRLLEQTTSMKSYIGAILVYTYYHFPSTYNLSTFNKSTEFNTLSERKIFNPEICFNENAIVFD